MSVKQVEIHFSDLNEDAQARVCYVLDTVPADENWDLDMAPLFVLERELTNEKG